MLQFIILQCKHLNIHFRNVTLSSNIERIEVKPFLDERCGLLYLVYGHNKSKNQNITINTMEIKIVSHIIC